MSRFQKFLKYLTTEKGRETSLYCVFAFGAGCFVLKWVPNTICLQQYREFLACYKDGFERKIPERVTRRFEKALDLLEVDELDRSRTKLFSVIGFDTFSAGSKHSVFGSLIGIPMNYEFQRKEDVPHSEFLIDGEPIKWGSDAGKMFEESLILTEQEQIFGICKEILLTQTFKLPLDCFYPLMGIIVGYGMGHMFNNRLNLFQRPRSLRMVLYSLVGLFSYGNYSFITDYTHCQYEASIDQKLASLGDHMVKAGDGYYGKILKRNVAIRALSGDNSAYSASGNINTFVRQRSLPLTVRKSYFEAKLEELKADQAQ